MNWILIIALLFALIPYKSSAESGPFMEASGGVAFYRMNDDDGVWYQDPYPHQFSNKAFAYRIGAGYKINPKWAVTLSWVDLGQVGVHSQAIYSDEAYFNCRDRAITGSNGCGHPKTTFDVKSLARGPELAVRFNPLEWGYVRAGAMRWRHQLTASLPEFNMALQEASWRTAVTAGVGVMKGPFFAEVNYYSLIDGRHVEGGYPPARSLIVPMIGLRLEF